MKAAVALCALLALASTALACDIPDCGLNVTQLIASKGYYFEQHNAITEDGFILSIQRMPRAYGSSTNNKIPALLMHGLLDCSATWVMNFPDESLAFILADAGFDVWLGNWRGNEYSNSNTHLNPDSLAFWDWTWDEMAKYDLPAMVNYVLNQTGAVKLLYAGHSQGTMVPFAAASAYPDVTAKLALFAALAPVAYMWNVESPLLQVASRYDLAELLEKLGEKQFLPSSAQIRRDFPIICQLEPALCADVICVITGCDKQNLNNTRYQVYTSIDPAGTSVKSMAHYSQNVKDKTFCMFDYGSQSANQQHYGQPTPPDYHLNQVLLPVALFHGGADILADPKDVAIMMQQLPAASVINSTYVASYAHMDFVWGENAHELVYPTVVELFRQYAPHTQRSDLDESP